MASITFDSFFDDLARGAIDMDSDTFKAMLVTSGYVPNKGTHTKRSDVTSEVVGTGYTAGGNVVTCTVAKDTSGHKVTFAFSNPSWTNATIAAAALVIYKARGGAASADELVCFGDFGATITSTAGAFAVTISAPITIQN